MNTLKILIVDDNPELLRMLKRGLELISQTQTDSAYQVTTCEDGVSGLEFAAEQQPAVIVIDVKMPASALDGIQLTQVLRGDPATAHIPLIILTALMQDHERFTGMASGTDIYLTKPQDAEQIHAAIQRALAISVTERDAAYRRLADDAPQP